VLRKARYVPLADVPYYSLRFVKDRLYRSWSAENRVAAWGPRFEGLQDILRHHELLEACALQWKYCVDKAASDLRQIEPDRKYLIRYEDFVQRPIESLRGLSHFLNVDGNDVRLKEMTADVFAGSVGTWKDQLATGEAKEIRDLIKPTLRKFGYTC